MNPSARINPEWPGSEVPEKLVDGEECKSFGFFFGAREQQNNRVAAVERQRRQHFSKFPKPPRLANFFDPPQIWQISAPFFLWPWSPFIGDWVRGGHPTGHGHHRIWTPPGKHLISVFSSPLPPFFLWVGQEEDPTRWRYHRWGGVHQAGVVPTGGAKGRWCAPPVGAPPPGGVDEIPPRVALWAQGLVFVNSKADLRRADFLVKRRAMEDAFMALKFIRNIHDMMVNKMYQQPRKEGSMSVSEVMGYITLERNGKTVDLFPGEVSTDRITAIQVILLYKSRTRPQLLMFRYLDAMDGKSTVSLLAECASSPDVNTRQALANALATAPSMWTLGNAGMGALKRLAEDNNPAVAAAASKAIDELRRQWELQEGDHLQFRMKKISPKEVDETDAAPDNQ
ncbi:hypothetical protein Taro_026791 [Colocasia esculenta]|uniref:Uncharacterized protein n=1 Tax=Colocasia esculenta TaxID=4460 RepID=A0A843VKM3_COLES|nr:hypothetical protein [Colocasia esculenta]